MNGRHIIEVIEPFDRLFVHSRKNLEEEVDTKASIVIGAYTEVAFSNVFDNVLQLLQAKSIGGRFSH